MYGLHLISLHFLFVGVSNIKNLAKGKESVFSFLSTNYISDNSLRLLMILVSTAIDPAQLILTELFMLIGLIV